MQFIAVRSVKAWRVVSGDRGDGERCHLHSEQAQLRPDSLKACPQLCSLPSLAEAPSDVSCGLPRLPPSYPFPTEAAFVASWPLLFPLFRAPAAGSEACASAGSADCHREPPCSAHVNPSGSEGLAARRCPHCAAGPGLCLTPARRTGRVPAPGHGAGARPPRRGRRCCRWVGARGSSASGGCEGGSERGAPAPGDALTPRCQWSLGTSLMCKPSAQGCGSGDCLGQPPGSPGTTTCRRPLCGQL